jgi:hypothetical protein
MSKSEISQLTGEIEELKVGFNNIADQLAHVLIKIAPNSSLATFEKEFNTLIRQKSNKLIDTFVIDVLLVHKDKILAGDDTYFMGQEFKNVTNGDSANISRVFEFKEIWKSLSPESKLSIKQYMKILTLTADKYLTSVMRLKELAPKV